MKRSLRVHSAVTTKSAKHLLWADWAGLSDWCSPSEASPNQSLALGSPLKHIAHLWWIWAVTRCVLPLKVTVVETAISFRSRNQFIRASVPIGQDRNKTAKFCTRFSTSNSFLGTTNKGKSSTCKKLHCTDSQRTNSVDIWRTIEGESVNPFQFLVQTIQLQLSLSHHKFATKGIRKQTALIT